MQELHVALAEEFDVVQVAQPVGQEVQVLIPPAEVWFPRQSVHVLLLNP